MFKRIYVCADSPETAPDELLSLEGVTPETLESFRGNKGEEGV